jgi:hypothetical protein
LANVFETSLQQRLDFFRFFHYSNSKGIVSVLKEGMLNVYVDLCVSHAFVAKEVLDVENVFGFVLSGWAWAAIVYTAIVCWVIPYCL